MAKTVEFFARDLGIKNVSTSRLITKAPAVLSLSLERNIVPTIDFLADELDLGIGRAIKCIETRPSSWRTRWACFKAHGQVFGR